MTGSAHSVLPNAEEVTWDGRLHSYRPKVDWRERVSPRLLLHTDTAEELDPISYEVLRNRFWTINIAHGETIVRISGSPIFQALDFSMSILTEDGEMIVSAPFVQYLNYGAPFSIRYTMEHLSESPGIQEGDVFLLTDPWIGAVHQMDVCLIYPLFIDGKLFCWVSNAGHQYDLGGIVPGGWPQNAPDVFSDPIVVPPIKIVEGGKMREDIEAMYLRQSRMPDLVALDLRAQIAGCRTAGARIAETCEEFGPSVVKAAMRRMLDQGREALVKKLDGMPDGRWSEIRYLDETMPGDRGSYPIQLNVEKRGKKLYIDNHGTHEQLPGPIGFTYLAFEGGAHAMVAVMMLYDQTFAIGAAADQMDFSPDPGLLSCVDYPAAVNGGVCGIVTHMNMMGTILARMLMSIEGQDRSDIMAPGSEFPMIVLSGSNDRGQYFGTALMDPGGMGSGARGTGDGIDTGGPGYSPLMKMPDVEVTEKFYPLLYLYRRNLADSGGGGRWRGGIGFEYAVTPYRADDIEIVTNTGGSAISTVNTHGLFGGDPSPPASFEIFRGTDLASRFGAAEVPQDLHSLESTETMRLRGKSNGIALSPGDVISARVVGGGGYGDPLEREADRVARDVRFGMVSRDAAEGVYGVILGVKGEVDVEATKRCRQDRHASRASWSAANKGVFGKRKKKPATGEPPRVLHEYVVARDVDGERVLACACCEAQLGGYHDNYRLGLLLQEGPVEQLPLAGGPAHFIDADVVLRRYCCPECHVLMVTEVAVVGDPILDEMRLA